jgi:Peptidase inhibitor family I36
VRPTIKEVDVMDAKVVRQYPGALVLTAALLGALVVWAAAPSIANAACNRGDFCLWENANRGGGSYHWSGPDANLHNDYFAPGVRVGDNASTAYNNGVGDPSGLVDVLAFKDTRFRGPTLCVPLGTEYSNLKSRRLTADHDVGDARRPGEPDGTWNDDISSYHWTTSCLP